MGWQAQPDTTMFTIYPITTIATTAPIIIYFVRLSITAFHFLRCACFAATRTKISGYRSQSALPDYSLAVVGCPSQSACLRVSNSHKKAARLSVPFVRPLQRSDVRRILKNVPLLTSVVRCCRIVRLLGPSTDQGRGTYIEFLLKHSTEVSL